MNRSIPATILAVIIIVLATGSGFAGDKEVVFDESFAVKAGDELKVTVGDMNVLLKTGKSNEAHVEVTVTGNLDKMRKRFEKMNFTAEIDDGALVLDTDDHNSWSTNWWGSSGSGGVHLTVTLPEKFDLHVQTSDGDISASGFEGDIELKTSDGDLIAGNLTGPEIYLKTSDGDIEASELSGGDVSLRSSDGDLTVERIEVEYISMATSDGNVRASAIKADKIVAKSSDGDLELDISGGELQAKTSDGDIDVTLSGSMALDLSTSDGDITIRAPKNFGARIDLKGEHVKLGGKVAIEGEVSDRRISGILGDGGPTVRARTSDGSVTLRFI